MKKSCAACGQKPVTTKTTFLCDNKERHLCADCWNDGQNDEFWDEKIKRLILARDVGKPIKMKKFAMAAEVTISLVAVVEAETLGEAMRKAEDLAVPDLCHVCSDAGDGTTEWQLTGSLDGEPRCITGVEDSDEEDEDDG